MTDIKSYACTSCRTVNDIDITDKPERFKILCKNELCKLAFVVDKDKPIDPSQFTHTTFRNGK